MDERINDFLRAHDYTADSVYCYPDIPLKKMQNAIKKYAKNVKEDDIIAWKKSNDLTFLNCACKFTEMASIDEEKSKRKEIKHLIKELKKVNPNVDNNIFTALNNVNLNCVIGTKKNAIYHSFLEEYDKFDKK